MSAVVPLTPHQARYYALELRRRAPTHDVAAIGSALYDAQIDLNPHQVEAALFGLAALRERDVEAPGRILADGVGLGTTIEAGLVLCQLWAERRRRLLVIAPAALRERWVQQLASKFGLPARIIEGRDQDEDLRMRAIVVVSYADAVRRAEMLRAGEWDLVVCDEAHRLRRAHDPSSHLARPLAQALRRFPKLLLTAIPVQHSLLELYGLASVVDERVFGDVAAFKARFLGKTPNMEDLRQRLQPIMHRTLRKDVLAHAEHSASETMTPPPEALHDAVSELLLLASSSDALDDRARSEEDARRLLNRVEALFWNLTVWALGDAARFDSQAHAFDLLEPPHRISRGRYELVRREGNGVAEPFVHRLTGPLGDHVLARGATSKTPPAHLVFDAKHFPRRATPVEALRGRSGWLRLDRLRVTGFAEEEHLLLAGVLDDGVSLDPEVIERLLLVGAEAGPARGAPPPALEEAARHALGVAGQQAAARNVRAFEAARHRLYRHAEDQILAAEERVKELRKQEQMLDREAHRAPTPEEERGVMKRLADVEERSVRARRELNEVEDTVRARRAAQLDELERRVTLRNQIDAVFVVSFHVV